MGDKPEKIDAPAPTHTDDQQPVARVAQEGFGKKAEAYDANRPGYTDAMVRLVLEEILALTTSTSAGTGSDVKYDVLELGAGTGKLTELVAPKLPAECRYLAVEPSSNFLERLGSKGLPVTCHLGPASAIPLPDQSVRMAVCAQSLHWFSDEASLREIHRVLVPGGKLVGVWNMKRFDEGHWTDEFYRQRLEVMARTGSSTSFWVNTMEWKAAIDASGLFSDAKHESLPGIDFRGTLDAVLGHFRTISCYNALPETECQACLDKLRAAILGYPDVDPEAVVFPFTSEMHVFNAV